VKRVLILSVWNTLSKIVSKIVHSNNLTIY